MRNQLYLICLLLIVSPLFSQDGQLLSMDEEQGKSILLIPFSYNYYLSDADFMLAEKNDKDPNEVRESMRYGLDGSVGSNLKLRYNTRMLLTDTAYTAPIDLEKIYASVSYKYAKPSGAEKKNDKASAKSWINNKFKKKDKDEDSQMNEDMLDAAVITPPADRQYMNAFIRDKDLFQEVANRYNASYVVLINQFELKTNFSTCLDRATNNFAREMSMHYTIYNSEGKHVAGDVITTAYPSNNNDLVEMMEKNFPKLARNISEAMPLAANRLTDEQ